MNTQSKKIDVNAEAAEIARLQAEIAKILEETAEKVQALGCEIGARSDLLERALDRRAPLIDPAKVAAAFAKHKVNAGELSSRLIEAIERHGVNAYPEKYEKVKVKWTLVETHR